MASATALARPSSHMPFRAYRVRGYEGGGGGGGGPDTEVLEERVHTSEMQARVPGTNLEAGVEADGGGAGAWCDGQNRRWLGAARPIPVPPLHS